jgi:hypothetical protein
MTGKTAAEIAWEVVRQNANLTTFEVDLEDARIADDVALALEELGCVVERGAGGTRLIVTCEAYVVDVDSSG